MLEEIRKEIEGKDAKSVLTFLSERFAEESVFSTSFGIEDQVITHMLAELKSNISIFTLDTGRLFPETYYVWNRTLEKYLLPIKAYYPNAEDVQNMVSTKGPSSFYDSVENRKECCHIRKIEPLQRAIKGYKIWITGIRAEQSVNRQDMTQVEWDEVNQMIKVHVLFSWTLQDVENYLKQNYVPYNPLHDKGYPSIGCQPCTRAIAPGDDFRAGRWWWEDKSKKECGLHATN